MHLRQRWQSFKENNVLMNFTVMLVPHKCNKKPIRFNVPVGVFILAFLALFTLLCFTTGFAYSAYQLHLATAENTRLDKISVAQEQQLFQLEENAQTVFERLEEINRSEQEIRDAVGLPEQNILGEGGLSEALLPKDAAYADNLIGDGALTHRLALLEATLLSIDNYEQQRLAQYEALAGDVTARLDYLAHIPSATPAPQAHYTAGFGVRINPFTRNTLEFHSGVDLADAYATPIYAAGAGVVVIEEQDASYGQVLSIDHGYGYISLYAHCSQIIAEPGETVQRGDVIALMGSTGRSTGVHVHFGVKYEGSWIDPCTVAEIPH